MQVLKTNTEKNKVDQDWRNMYPHDLQKKNRMKKGKTKMHKIRVSENLLKSTIHSLDLIQCM